MVEEVSACLDVGLLSPVRAGCPVEEAVCDQAWLRAMLEAEAGLARAQARLGTVPATAARAITEAVRGSHFSDTDLVAVARAARETANPVVPLVKSLTSVVAAIEPTAADYVHRGSTSQDIFDTGAMIVADRSLRLVRADLGRIATALAALVEQHRDTPMAGRTLALHAVPTTFGLKAGGWLELVLDAAERLDSLLTAGLPVSLGGAAGTLAGYLEYARPLDGGAYVEQLARAFAEEVGLGHRPTLPWHALRTPVADIAAVTAFVTGALGKLAVDVLVLARTEIAEVAEPTAAGRGASSAMPHKRNPVLATMIRSAALQVPVLAAGLTQGLATEDERSAGMWHAEWQMLRECLRLCGGAAHTAVELAEGLRARPARMLENLELTGNQLVSERLTAVLAPRLGKAVARELLTRVSAASAETGRPLGDLLAETPGLEDHLDLSELPMLLDPTRYTGAAGALADRVLDRYAKGTSWT
ncbi:class-II fumarase/aspartase family protein [Streptomyces olindensis]|uniref:class-II fumarase/aspartase family protein n=1 Tax=Streptomyces olindensis TaxID=358823 RepID=UPI003649BA0D